MKSLLLCLAVLAACVSLKADVVTSAVCSANIPNIPSQTNTGVTSCDVKILAVNGASEFASRTINPSVSFGDTIVTNFSFSGQVVGESEGGSQVVLSGRNSAVLTTSGPVRNGTLVMTELIATGGLATDEVYTLSIGSFSQTCNGQSTNFYVFCIGSLLPDRAAGIRVVTLPFILGQDFTLLQTVSSNMSAGGGGTPHYVNGSFNLSIAMFNADGSIAPILVATTGARWLLPSFDGFGCCFPNVPARS